MYRRQTLFTFLSLCLHVAIIVLVCMVSTRKPPYQHPVATVTIATKDISAYFPSHSIDTRKMHGGGGGGNKSPLPPSKGKLPKKSPKQFTPPDATPKPESKLVMDPSIVLPPEITLPATDIAVLGSPPANISPPSAGPGSHGGIGTGQGGGVGPGKGPGVGPGEGGGTGGGVYHLGNDITPPVILYQVKPQYALEAQRAKLEGTVELLIEIDKEGNVQHIEVTKSLGMGLDEKTIEAVKRWKFKPALKNGKPIMVSAPISCRFRLL